MQIGRPAAHVSRTASSFVFLLYIIPSFRQQWNDLFIGVEMLEAWMAGFSIMAEYVEGGNCGILAESIAKNGQKDNNEFIFG